MQARTRPLSSLKSDHYVLVIDDDASFFQEIQAIAQTRRIQTQLAATLDEARLFLNACQPDVILLSLLCSGSEEEGLTFLDELSQLAKSVPIIVSSTQTSFEHRLQASRLGAQGFLLKPLVPDHVLDMLTNVMKRHHSSETNVVIVSEDQGVLEYLKRLLMYRGLYPTLIQDPAFFWSTLEQIAPDLVILDVETSSISGLELCRVVRQDIRWNDLPVILLSERTDRGMLQQVFAAGADDYVQKPIFEPEFITRVLNRLERSRLLHELADTDSLTHLTNRRKATIDINRLISIAERQDKSLCFIIFDMDYFKQINDEYGHAAGDQTLRNTGAALKRMFRQADVMARWGGDEFVLGLFDSNGEQCAKRLQQLMETLYTQQIGGHSTTTIEVTYSVGIAEYPTDGYTLDTLYQSADQALYYAKANGRNQICLAQTLSFLAAHR